MAAFPHICADVGLQAPLFTVQLGTVSFPQPFLPQQMARLSSQALAGDRESPPPLPQTPFPPSHSSQLSGRSVRSARGIPKASGHFLLPGSSPARILSPHCCLGHRASSIPTDQPNRAARAISPVAQNTDGASSQLRPVLSSQASHLRAKQGALQMTCGSLLYSSELPISYRELLASPPCSLLVLEDTEQPPASKPLALAPLLAQAPSPGYPRGSLPPSSRCLPASHFSKTPSPRPHQNQHFPHHPAFPALCLFCTAHHLLQIY